MCKIYQCTLTLDSPIHHLFYTPVHRLEDYTFALYNTCIRIAASVRTYLTSQTMSKAFSIRRIRWFRESSGKESLRKD